MIRILVAAALFIASGSANAHQSQLINSWVKVAGTTVTVVHAFKGVDMVRALNRPLMIPGEDRVDDDLLAEHANEVANYVIRQSVVRQGNGRRCAPMAHGIKTDRDGIVIQVDWLCDEIDEGLIYGSHLFLNVLPQARQLVHFGDRQEALEQTLLDREVTEVSIFEPPAWPAVFARYVLAGIEHIFIGADHIAFLIALLLWARRLMPVIAVVTAFTIAHSVTLSVAVLDLFTLPSAWVEFLIALTIIYVGAENFFLRNVSRRWKLTFALGLIHGFGFAGVLREFGLPGTHVALPLAGFNIGVEVGQVALVSVALAMLWLLDRVLSKPGDGAPARSVRLVYTVSGAIVLYGIYLAIDRMVIL